MSGMTHHIKCNFICFQAKLDGKKTFEIRDNSDRFFQNGDIVIEREVVKEEFGVRTTGRKLRYTVGFICTFKQQADHVVFSCLGVEQIFETKDDDELPY